jgi:sugar phosphate isomerase/epimerase
MIRIALASLAVPPWDAATLAGRAREWGYDGVELAYPLAGDPDAVRAAIEQGGVAVACLATRISMPRRGRDRPGAVEQLRGAVDLAGRLGCGVVKMLDTVIHPGQTAGGTAADMAQWLLPVADHAAARGVTLAVENALYFRRAKDLWMLLEAIGHPAVGAAWDLGSGVAAGESPAVSVPTLNLRIQYARVADRKSGTASALGEGEVPVEEFVRRLKGIGYGGYVTVGYGAGVAEEVLAGAAARWRGWIKPVQAGKGARHG